MTIKLVVTGVLILAVAHLLRGHDILTGTALLLLFVVVLARVVFAIRFRPGTEPPLSGGGGRRPPDAPVPRPPNGRPPTLVAAAEVRR